MSSPKNTREQRREAARAQAEKLRADQAAKERRSRNILLGALGAIVVLVIVAGIWIYSEAQKTAFDSTDAAVPAAANDGGGIVVGPEGVGDTSGERTLEVYLDFMCPYCGQFELANIEDLTEQRESGDLNVVYYPVNYLDGYSLGTLYSTRAANAVATVAQDAPEAFIPFVEALFVNQPAENTEGLSDEEIAAIAVEAGVPQGVADSFAEGTYADYVGLVAEQASREGVSGTPTVILDGTNLRDEGVNYYEAGQLGAYLRGE
ncbi:DsbA family protein [Serinibacter salmoneus]|uniref:Protein-disulfide isomerase n=1 Tax=Serinibacter salmoneus TaxID=556530 RepID=A0A2A9D1K6_9MICO|nr:thioredoxin domain-containing protein [Serinibacter salmoneus]PFG20533.1 protein-disulfide isomerase [Serinibacter salmoneus]